MRPGEKPSKGSSVSLAATWTNEQRTNVLERLTTARDRIKRGWCRGRYYSGTDEGQKLTYCMLGSILDQKGLLDQTTRRAGLFLLDSIDSIYGKFVYDDIVAFNDEPKRKKEEVVRVFNQAIHLLSQRKE